MERDPMQRHVSNARGRQHSAPSAGHFRSGLAIALVLAATAIGPIAAPGRAQEQPSPAENAWLRTWIHPSCCVTNNCCFRVAESELTPLPDERWRIHASGEVVRRTDYSQDGGYWRCACDNVEGKWVVHPRARTRCIFTPMHLG